MRARVVAGCPRLAADYEALRMSVLQAPRDAASLRDEVVKMREKMRDHLLPAEVREAEGGLFHLKHSSGGIVDIEFMVQFMVLAWGQAHPSLTRWSDNIRILESLAETGLSGLERRLPRELSGGQRQRVAIARVLVRDRPVLLLDEPFAALGPALRRDMLNLVGRIHRQRKMTVLLVSHDPSDVQFAADHAAFLDAGRVVANRPVDRLFGASDIPGLQGYLGT